MNFILDSPKNLFVREGDVCVIYVSDHEQFKFPVNKITGVSTKFGLLKGRDLIGHPYGTKFNLKTGWVLVLRLTPELWTQLLPHRTQILYQADISFICAHLDIKPGSVVVESGTGSGSLSHSIIRSILPNGTLYTFDYDKDRVVAAEKEFREHGYSNNVEVTQRNVYDQGYGDNLKGQVDACIIDLPQPWFAVEHAYQVLKPYESRLCVFTIGIEQVIQTIDKMNALKFQDIATYECLTQAYDTRPTVLRKWSPNFLEEMATVDRTRFENIRSGLNPSRKRKIDQEYGTLSEREFKEPNNGHHEQDDDDLDKFKQSLKDPRFQFSANMLPRKSLLQCKLASQSVGHSGYLTVATKRSLPLVT